MMIPMPMPAPIAMNTIVDTPLARPNHFSPTAARLTLFSTKHGEVEPVADDLERIEAALGHDVVRQRGDPAARLVDDPRRGDPQRERPAVHGARLIDHLADHLEDLHPDGAARRPWPSAA